MSELSPAGNQPRPTAARRAMRLRHSLLFVIVLLSVGCDQLTKTVAQDGLRGQPPVSYLGGALRLLYAENQGAFLGLGGGLSDGLRFALLIVGTSLIVLVAAVLLVMKADAPWPAVLGGALVVAGGIGNLIDRIANDGRVVDFMHMRLGPLETGVFNVADVHLMVGAGLLVLMSFKHKPPGDEPASPPAEAAPPSS